MFIPDNHFKAGISTPSKPIAKVSDDAMNMIRDILGGSDTHGFNIDSIYCLSGFYYVLELLCCDTYPAEKSHPSKYWNKNKQKFLSLFAVAKKLSGRLLLINYEKTHQVFKVMELVEASESGCRTIGDKVMNRNDFTRWFCSLNDGNYIETQDI